VGLASAIGQTVDVPVIIRSLADSMAMLQQEDFPIPFHPEFLATLDVGAHGKDNRSRVVSKYERAWWNGRKPRSLANANILDRSSLEKCLDIHKTELEKPSEASTPTTSGASTGITIATMPASTSTIALGTGAGENADQGRCFKCPVYEKVLAETLNDLLSIHRFSNAMSTSSKNQFNLDMRRASTFNLLHEASVIKETKATGPASSSRPTPESVRERAEDELKRLMALPPSSHKWTWGVSLNQADVLALHRSGTRPGTYHSGYDISLKEGKLTGESTIASTPTAHGLHDELPDETALSPPESHSADLPYFANFGQRKYEPLALPTPTMDEDEQNSAHQAMPVNETPVHQQWIPDSLAEQWIPEEVNTWIPAEEEQPWIPAEDEYSAKGIPVMEQWIPAEQEDRPASQESSAKGIPAEDEYSAKGIPVMEQWIPAEQEDRSASQESSAKGMPWIPAEDEYSAKALPVMEQWIPAEEEEDRPASPEDIPESSAKALPVHEQWIPAVEQWIPAQEEDSSAAGMPVHEKWIPADVSAAGPSPGAPASSALDQLLSHELWRITDEWIPADEDEDAPAPSVPVHRLWIQKDSEPEDEEDSEQDAPAPSVPVHRLWIQDSEPEDEEDSEQDAPAPSVPVHKLWIPEDK
jgi:hypothetical protein